MKRFLKILLGIVLLISLITVMILNQSKFGQHPKGERLERIKKSPNYKDGSFKNLSETAVMTSDKSTIGAMWDFIFAKKYKVKPEDRDPADPSTWGKVTRNELCPCGSGKKYKHCHGAT